MMENLAENRNMGLDVFRILCCFGVLSYHVMSSALFSKGGMILYYGAAYCIPGFFLLSGFLLASKKGVSLEYIEAKIIGVAKMFFGWCIFWSAFYFFCEGKLYNPLNEFVSAANSGGIMPVGWFLFTWSLLLFLGRWLFLWLEKNFVSFCAVCIALIFVLASRKLDFLTGTMTQARWLHLYLAYFMCGMALNRVLKQEILFKRRSIFFVLCTAAFALTSLYYAKKVEIQGTSRLPHTYYGSWYYSIWLFSLFYIVLNIPFHRRLSNFTGFLSKHSFSVYMAHLPILFELKKVIPIKTLLSAKLYWGGGINTFTFTFSV